MLRHFTENLLSIAKNILSQFIIFLVKIYRVCISPFFLNRCRFHPSCSQYALDAIKTHGPITGSWLTFKRILRCNPCNVGGIDEVPNKGKSK